MADLLVIIGVALLFLLLSWTLARSVNLGGGLKHHSTFFDGQTSAVLNDYGLGSFCSAHSQSGGIDTHGPNIDPPTSCHHTVLIKPTTS